jgi:hypothetical protein
MGFFSEIAVENTIKWLVEKLKAKIEKNKDLPEAVRVLKELGNEALDSLPGEPDWAGPYRELFRSENP